MQNFIPDLKVDYKAFKEEYERLRLGRENDMVEEIAFVEKIFSSFEENGIEFCILRNSSEIADGDAHDIDMSYAVNESKKVNKIFNDVSASMGWKLHLTTGRLSDKNNIKCFHYHKVLDDGSCKLVHFDLFPNFEWAGYVLLNNSDLLNNVSQSTIYHEAAPEAEAVTKLFIRLLYNGYVKEKYKKDIFNIFTQTPEKVQCVLNKFLSDVVATDLICSVQNEKWELIEQKRDLYINDIKKNCKRIRMSKYRYLLEKMHSKPGIMIAFEGPDGSGKSTIINGLYRTLENTFPDGMRAYYHWGPGVVIKKQQHSDSSVTEPHVKKTYGKVKSFLKFMLFNVDYILGYWLKIRVQLGKGHLVIFDGYYYDYYLDKIRYRLNIEDRTIFNFMPLIPKPDITFILHGDADILYERKKEISVNEINEQLERLNHLNERLENSIVINVNQDIDNVVNQVSGAILNYANARYQQKNMII